MEGSIQGDPKACVINVKAGRGDLNKQIWYRNVYGVMPRCTDSCTSFLSRISSSMHHYTNKKIPTCISCMGLLK